MLKIQTKIISRKKYLFLIIIPFWISFAIGIYVGIMLNLKLPYTFLIYIPTYILGIASWFVRPESSKNKSL